MKGASGQSQDDDRAASPAADSSAAGVQADLDRLARVDALVRDVDRRRRLGEVVDDATLVDRHPDLADALRERLAALRDIHRVFIDARPAPAPISPTAEGLPPGPSGKDSQDANASAPAADGPDGEAAALPLIPRYIVRREISRGGQAVVFEAVQEAIGKRVAIKVIYGGRYATSQQRARFDQEAQILAALDHPNVVRLLDRGCAADKSFFIALEYVDGPGFIECLDRLRGRGLHAVLEFFAKVADGVGEAHAKRIVHRDLKPSNILIDARGEPRVADFGLARLMDIGPEHRDARMASTQTGQIVGSLAWTSPEQANGDHRMVDQRTDVYTLGLLLYLAIAGQLPHAVEGTLRQVQDRKRKLPLAPSAVAGAPIKEGGRALDAIILKALATSPLDRHTSAAALAESLRGFMRGEPAQFRRPLLTRRALVTAVIPAAAVAVGAAIIVRDRWLRAEKGAGPQGATPLTSPTIRPTALNSIGMEFVQIQPGTFLMGAPLTERDRIYGETPRKITLTSRFEISRMTVTQSQWAQVVRRDVGDARYSDDNLPANGMNWNEANDFCAQLSTKEKRIYRLPTEAEWEYCCRAGGSGPYGSTKDLDDVAWYKDHGDGKLHTAGLLLPNPWGLFDMLGNVWEWTNDDFDDYVLNPPNDPWVTGTGSSAAVVRGGACDTPHKYCRAATRSARHKSGPVDTDLLVGFRLVRPLA